MTSFARKRLTSLPCQGCSLKRRYATRQWEMAHRQNFSSSTWTPDYAEHSRGLAVDQKSDHKSNLQNFYSRDTVKSSATAILLQEIIGTLGRYRTRNEKRAMPARAEESDGQVEMVENAPESIPEKVVTSHGVRGLLLVLNKVYANNIFLPNSMYCRLIHICAGYGQVAHCERLYARLAQQLDGEGNDEIRVANLKKILFAIRRRATAIREDIFANISPRQNMYSLGLKMDESIESLLKTEYSGRRRIRPVRHQMAKAIYDRRELPAKALAILQEIKTISPNVPDNDMYHWVMSILNELGQDEAYHFFVLQTYGIDLSNPAGSDIPDFPQLELQAKADQSTWVSRLFDRLPSKHAGFLRPDTRTLNDMISFLGRRGRVSDMIVLYEVMTAPLPHRSGEQATPTAIDPNYMTIRNLLMYSLESTPTHPHLAIHYLDMMRQFGHARSENSSTTDIRPRMDDYQRIFRHAVNSHPKRFAYAQAAQTKLSLDAGFLRQPSDMEQVTAEDSDRTGVALETSPYASTAFSAGGINTVGIVQVTPYEDRSSVASVLEAMTTKLEKLLWRERYRKARQAGLLVADEA